MKITRRQFLRNTLLGSAPGACALSLGCLPAFSSRTERQSKPNIIIIMADDMGFSDAGCFGGEIHTPNLDRLAENGVRFTQFYNCARCCPTRASLLTGQYPHKVGLVQNGRDLARNGITIAEALRQAGYQTAMAGKWHLSRTAPLADKKLHQKWLDHQCDPGHPFALLETYPANRGFDRHYGVIWGVIDYFDPFLLVDGTEAIKTVPDDYYFTDAVTEKSVEYIEQFSRTDKPFFLYVAHCGPHWPLHAQPEDIAKYKDTYKGGCHTPLIIHWPKGLKTKPGSITKQAGHVMDIMPTCLELAGASYPSEYKGHKLTALDGKSFAPILAGGKRKEHEKVFFEHMGGRAVRMGDWKLVALKDEPWRLYNLAKDRTETNDLAEKHPDRIQTMSAEWDKWAGRVGL